jgi:CelD/BcsL family acetyltransferase involved in cellulose biosynthesis
MVVPEQHAGSSDAGPAGMRVFDLQPGDRRWEQFVANRPGALPYHHPGWSQALRETFHYSPSALGCADHTGRLTGILPLVEKRSLLTGPYLSSLPHTPAAGPLADDRESLQALLRAAVSRVDQSAARWLQVRTQDPSLDGLGEGFSRIGWEPGCVLDLPGNPEHLRFASSRDRSATMRAVRKASRSGVTVREASSLDDVARWYKLYLFTMRAHAAPARPFRFFEKIWEILAPQGRLRLLLAERKAGGKTRLLAGSVFLLHGHTVIYAFNGRDRSQLEFRPNDAIHWMAITEACGLGFLRYDFGEVTSSNDGLARYKAKWGARRVPSYRYNYPRRRELERGVLKPGPLRGITERAWPLVPLPVTEALGGFVCRRL